MSQKKAEAEARWRGLHQAQRNIIEDALFQDAHANCVDWEDSVHKLALDVLDLAAEPLPCPRCGGTKEVGLPSIGGTYDVCPDCVGDVK